MVAQPLDDLDGRRAQLARDNLIVFCTRLYRNYVPADHLWRIAEALQAVERGDLKRVVLTMPPRHGKSELASVNFPPWFLGRNPDKRIIATSYSGGLANRFSRRARNILAEPLWPFPGIETAGDRSAVQSWDIAGHRGGYVSSGVGGSITGHGADILLVDDPVANAEQALSIKIRETTWEWFTQTALTRLEPDGAVILIGTRWHEDDLIGRALEMPGHEWTHIDFPAITEHDDGSKTSLWPARFTVDDLEQRRREIGSRAFAALYQQRPSPEEGGILKKHWWRFWHVPGQPLDPVPVQTESGLVLCPVVPLPYAFDETIQSWDMAFKDASDGSYVVGQIWSKLAADAFLRDQIREHLDFPRSVLAVESMTRQWPDANLKLVEDAANGPAVVSTLQKRIAGLVPVRADSSKAARANAIAPWVESGNVYLPHPRIAPWVNDFIEECATVPNGAHDDMADAAAQGVTRLLKQESLDSVLGDAMRDALNWTTR